MDNTLAHALGLRYTEDMTTRIDRQNEPGWPSEAFPLQVIVGDTREVIRSLPDKTFQCVITSPPYWGVRDYGFEKQIGAERDL